MLKDTLPKVFSRDIAKSLLLEGNVKITHYLFSSDEFLYGKNGMVYDENNYLFDDWVSVGVGAHNGFRMRSGQSWEDGWSLYKGE